MIDFIVNVWMRVLEQEAMTATGDGKPRVYRNLLPDLVWSAQEKHTPRNAQSWSIFCHPWLRA